MVPACDGIVGSPCRTTKKKEYTMCRAGLAAGHAGHTLSRAVDRMQAAIGGDLPLIALEDVAKSYDGKVALAPTTLEVPAQRSLALIGPSGCGKSTLLRLVVGLISPDSGRITVGGEPMTARTCRALRLHMGYVIQDGGLFPHLTAAQNVTLLSRHL